MTVKKLIKIIKHPKIIGNYLKYRILAKIAKNTLNDGERYDPLISKKVSLFDPTQEGRYFFAQDFIIKEDTVLDIACGTGYGTSILSEVSKHVTGVDISEEAITFANKNYKKDNNEFVVQDFFKVETKADVVVSFETVEHINTDLEEVFKKLINLTNRRLIVSTPYMEEPGRNRYHMHSEINESHYKVLESFGKLKFYYQSFDGKTTETKNNKDFIINIIAVLNK